METLEKPQTEPAQILRLRVKTTRITCCECGTSIPKNGYAVRVKERDNKLAHLECAGTEHRMATCTSCFMIASNCRCEC